jgi:hypothetical protein
LPLRSSQAHCLASNFASVHAMVGAGVHGCPATFRGYPRGTPFAATCASPSRRRLICAHAWQAACVNGRAGFRTSDRPRFRYPLPVGPTAARPRPDRGRRSARKWKVAGGTRPHDAGACWHALTVSVPACDTPATRENLESAGIHALVGAGVQAHLPRYLTHPPRGGGRDIAPKLRHFIPKLRHFIPKLRHFPDKGRRNTNTNTVHHPRSRVVPVWRIIDVRPPPSTRAVAVKGCHV